MTAVDVISTHLSPAQIALGFLTLALSAFAVVAACVFVGVLAREHVKHWRKRPAYRRMPVPLY